MIDGINVFLFMAIVYVASVGGDRITSWTETKRQIREETLELHDPATVYGGCRILNNWKVDLHSCTYSFKGETPKEGNIHIEHIVPAKRMMDFVGCGGMGIVECRKKNGEFKACHNNKLNLYPAVSAIIRYRGSKDFTELKEEESMVPFGSVVGFRKSIDGDGVEPPDRSKIAVATAYFAMEDAGCIRLSDEEVEIFGYWLDE